MCTYIYVSYVYRHAFIHAHKYTHTHTYAFIQTCAHTRMHIHERQSQLIESLRMSKNTTRESRKEKIEKNT